MVAFKNCLIDYVWTLVMYWKSREVFLVPFQGRLCTLRIFFQILLNHTEIRLHLPCTDCFGTANGQYPFVDPNLSGFGKYNLISV